MTVALYARVSSQRQTNTQTIDQQLDRLRARTEESDVRATACLVFRDDGYSGTTLRRPGLDALRDAVASAEVERILITAPDRLARKDVHQVLLLEELERFGCVVEFLDRPMSHDPHDQLFLQIRGAVAEYERSLIAERMRANGGEDGWPSCARARCCPGPACPMATASTQTAPALPVVCRWTRQQEP